VLHHARLICACALLAGCVTPQIPLPNGTWNFTSVKNVAKGVKIENEQFCFYNDKLDEPALMDNLARPGERCQPTEAHRRGNELALGAACSSGRGGRIIHVITQNISPNEVFIRGYGDHFGDLASKGRVFVSGVARRTATACPVIPPAFVSSPLSFD
jgi:hypothetical protein